MTKARPQLNLRLTPEQAEEIEKAIGEIQRASPGDGPVPTKSDVVRHAILEMRDRIKKGKRS